MLFADVWMFGILMYEILSGKKPHGSAENLVSVAIDIRETGRIPQLDASVDVFFKQLMVKCCQFEPDHRPVSHKHSSYITLHSQLSVIIVTVVRVQAVTDQIYLL